MACKPFSSDGKVSAWNAGDLGSIHGLGRSPGEGNGNSLQNSCLRIPWTEEPGGLQSKGSQRVEHDWATPFTHSLTQASLSITNSRSSLKLTSIKSVMPSSHLIISRPLLLLPPNPPSIRIFSNESTLHMRWPKYWSFSFLSITPSKEHPGLISFRMDWLDLLAVQGTLNSLL